jgi:hypothetical protein
MGSEVVVTAAVTLLGSGLSLTALWLRLRFALRAERERRRYLLTAATVLPAGSRIHEQRGDGSHLALAVGPAPCAAGGNDE